MALPAPAPPRFMELQAPASWRCVDFISDLHLQAGDTATFEAWREYMRMTPADAVFILGDLFEVWVGDDGADAPGFAADCAAVLQSAARNRSVFFMHGNRDFLVGPGFIARCGATLLDDPTVLGFAGARWLLSHGDALCLADTDYLRFRDQVRSPVWQQQFLARPLAERESIARSMRSQSEAAQKLRTGWIDVDDEASLGWLSDADAAVLIHGHTHRPADHRLDGQHRRIVLSDWDAASSPPRLQVLRLGLAGPQRLGLFS